MSTTVVSPANPPASDVPNLRDLVNKQAAEIAQLRATSVVPTPDLRQQEREAPDRGERRARDAGRGFQCAPEQAAPGKTRRVAAHERSTTPKQSTNDEATLFFDEAKVPVETIVVPNPEIADLPPEQVEIIGQKVSHRLA